MLSSPKGNNQRRRSGFGRLLSFLVFVAIVVAPAYLTPAKTTKASSTKRKDSNASDSTSNSNSNRVSNRVSKISIKNTNNINNTTTQEAAAETTAHCATSHPSDRPRIAIATMCIPLNRTSCSAPIAQTFVPWAQKHGYDLRVLGERIDDEKSYDMRFSKVLFVLNLLNEQYNCGDSTQTQQSKYDAVFWLDADSVIMNTNISARGFLDHLQPSASNNKQSKDLLISADKSALLNSGQFLARNTPWSRQLFERWYEMRIHESTRVWTDQSGLMQVLMGCNVDSSENQLRVCHAKACNTPDCMPKKGVCPECERIPKAFSGRQTHGLLHGDHSTIFKMGVSKEMQQHVVWIAQLEWNMYWTDYDRRYKRPERMKYALKKRHQQITFSKPRLRQIQVPASFPFRVHCPGSECGAKKERLQELMNDLQKKANDRKKRYDDSKVSS